MKKITIMSGLLLVATMIIESISDHLITKALEETIKDETNAAVNRALKERGIKIE